MPRIGWTVDPAVVANTNRDGSGTLYKICRIDPGGQYIDRIICYSFGTNIQSEGVIIGSNGNGLGNPNNNFMLGNLLLTATTLGTPLTTDIVTFTIDAWLEEHYELYGLVQDAQAAGRQFVAFNDRSFQVNI